MSIYDDYITGDDKPFAENINDALLLSNVFNFNVPVSLPSDFTNGEWINNTTQRKAGVSIIQLPEGLPNTLTVNGDKITGTGTMKLLVYPNFNSFGKFYRITWESENSNIQVNLKTKNGTMIAQNINNGLITSTSVELQKLQQILVEVVFTANDTLTGLVITMQNKIRDDRHTVDLGMSSVTGLEDELNSLESNLSSLNSNVTQKINNLNTEVWGSNTQTGNSRIDNLNTEVWGSNTQTGNSRIDNLDTNYNTATQKISNLNTEVWGSNTQTGNSRIDNLNTEVWGSNTQTGNSRIDSLESNVTGLESDLNSLESDLDSLESSKADIAHTHFTRAVRESSALSNIGTSANAIQSVVNEAIDEKIGSLDTRVNNFDVGYPKVLQLSSSVWTGGNNLFLFRMGHWVVAFINSGQLKYTSTGWKDMATLPTGYRPIMNTPLAVINNSSEAYNQWRVNNNVVQVYCATANNTAYTGCLGVWITPDDYPTE